MNTPQIFSDWINIARTAINSLSRRASSIPMMARLKRRCSYNKLNHCKIVFSSARRGSGIPQDFAESQLPQSRIFLLCGILRERYFAGFFGAESRSRILYFWKIRALVFSNDFNILWFVKRSVKNPRAMPSFRAYRNESLRIPVRSHIRIRVRF